MAFRTYKTFCPGQAPIPFVFFFTQSNYRISTCLLNRDDGLRIWNAITDFIVEFVNIFYHSDDDLSKDQELQSWAMDIHINGIPTREGDVDHGFLKNFQTRNQLVHVLTCIAFTCSCQHAAVNFPQMEITAFVPNVPPVMRLPPPTRKNEATMKMIMDTLPSKSQAGWHIATVYTLTRIANDEVRGLFPENFCSQLRTH